MGKLVTMIFKNGEKVCFEAISASKKVVDGTLKIEAVLEGDDFVVYSGDELCFMSSIDQSAKDEKIKKGLIDAALEVGRIKNAVREMRFELQFYAEGGNDSGLRARNCLDRFKTV
jgi:hypothetical protein